MLQWIFLITFVSLTPKMLVNCMSDHRQLYGDLFKQTKQNLECHNYYRKKHHAPLLSRSPQLDMQARSFSYELSISSSLYPSGRDLGESLYFTKRNITGSTACENWYKEIKHYDFNDEDPENQESYMHFTQMIWKNTTKVGYSWDLRNDGIHIIVVNYWPSGNIKGLYKDNVLPI